LNKPRKQPEIRHDNLKKETEILAVHAKTLAKAGQFKKTGGIGA
jgi:hypothetical protein